MSKTLEEMNKEYRDRRNWMEKELDKLWKEYKKNFRGDSKTDFSYYLFNCIPKRDF